MTNASYPTWIEINLQAVKENTRIIKDIARVPLMAVVKNDAYGHGSLECALAVLEAGADWLAVVRVEEARELREAGIKVPIMVLGSALPGEFEQVIKYDLTLPVFDLNMVRMLSEKALAADKKVKVHLKVDTGMSRFGIFPEEALGFAQELQKLSGLDFEGVFSHFATADVPGHPLVEVQIKRFNQVLDSLKAAGINPEWVHMSSSPAIVNHPEAHFNLVRAGGALFGVGLEDENDDLLAGLKRAFTWKARLVSCKRFPAGWGVGYGQDYTTREGEIIGVVPVGHGDGFLRSPENEVLVDGKKVPVVGLVCMDQFMLSLPEFYPIGTEVVLVGTQGDQRITPEEVGRRWKTSASAATEIKKRVPRIYFK